MSRGGVRRILAHAMDVRSVLGAVVIVLGLAACSIRPGETPSLPSWPVSAEPLPTATSGTGGQVTCGGRSFPRSGLTQPNGAEDASGPEFDALRASLAKFGSEFPGSSTWTWRLAGRDDTGAIFLARTDAFGSPGWVSTEVAADVTGWRPVSMGQCDPQTVLSAEFGPASWALDPAFPPPTPASVDLHILVWERACSGGSPTTGRTTVFAFHDRHWPVVFWGQRRGSRDRDSVRSGDPSDFRATSASFTPICIGDDGDQLRPPNATR